MTIVNGDALVLRFRPTQPDSVRRSAEREFLRAAHYGLSVFADLRQGEESDADLRTRLVQDAGMTGTHRRIYVCARAHDLIEQGFLFLKDNDDEEAPTHYCVDIGAGDLDDAVGRFLGTFVEEVNPHETTSH